MDGKAKFIFPAILSCVMAFLMTAVVTFLNIGIPPDFVRRWISAFIVAWPLAYIAALIASPIARRGTAWIVAKLEGRKS